jgi:hypothetical protein
MNTKSSAALKVVLVAVGAYIIFIGIDFGLGGFKTLGWQGSGVTDFVQATDPARYGVQDSHFRFLGGAFGALGAWMIVGATDLRKHQRTLNALLTLIVAGGLMRLTSGDPNLLLGGEITLALLVEIVLSSVLYVWLARAVKAAG